MVKVILSAGHSEALTAVVDAGDGSEVVEVDVGTNKVVVAFAVGVEMGRGTLVRK